jgi:hypothetical protein
MIAAALAAALTSAAQAGASAPVPAEFVAGRAALGGWRMEAVTVVNEGGASPPSIGNSRCTISGRGLRLVFPRNYGGSLEIGGHGLPFATSDIAAIALGGAVYEARMRPVPFLRARYSDVAYPRGHVDPDAAGPVETALGVRREPADPWLNIAYLLDDLLEVRSIGIRYRTRNGEARARLSVAGLSGAISWCRRAFESNRARTLPRPIRR